MFGWRGRIGLIIPSSNTTMEGEFAKHLPLGVSLHVARIPLKEVTVAGLEEMNKLVCSAAQSLVDAGVDVIVYGCTTGGLLFGVEYMRALTHQLEKTTGLPIVVTAQAVVDFMKAKGAQKIVIATPYIEEINQKEKEFMQKNGFEVLAIQGLGLKDNLEIGRQEPYVAYNLGKTLLKEYPQADLLFISCTNFRTFGILNILANDLQKPAVSSNQATLIQTLRVLKLSESVIKDVVSQL